MTPRPRILVLEGLGGTSDCIWEAGATPIEIAPYALDRISKQFETGTVEGLVLTGGGDVHPSRYGQDHKHTATYGISELRDKVEFSALRLARKYDVPVLGICRGSQVINVESGGSLWQNIPDRRNTSAGHKCGDMLVNVSRGSRLSQAIHGRKRADTIHLHHQAVRRVGRGLTASAHHRDGTIEAIESVSGRWVLGVQFHPEMARDDAPITGVFRELVIAASERAGVPTPERREMRRYTSKYAAQVLSAASKYEWPGVLGRETRPDAYEYDHRGYMPVAPNSSPTASTRTGSHYVETSWEQGNEWCHICHIPFDYYDDYTDHMHIVHALRATVMHGTNAAVLTRVPTADKDYDPDSPENVIAQVQRQAITTGKKVG